MFCGDKFSYVPQSNNTYLLSISINADYAKGYIMTRSQVKRMIAMLRTAIKNITEEEISND